MASWVEGERKPQQIELRGRTFTVSLREVPDRFGRKVYYLTGRRGASYFTLRNVKDPSLMMLLDRRTAAGQPFPDLWLSDAGGTLHEVGVL